MKIYTKNVGRKFDKDGNFKLFEGNTIICKLKNDCSFFDISKEISEKFKALPAAMAYTFLPYSSFHMTMIQGVCDVDRTRELWSSYLPLDCKLKESDMFFEERMKSASEFPTIHMAFDYIDITNNIIIIRLKPKTDKDSQTIKKYRDELSSLIGIKFPDYETYGFHVSIAYQIWENSPELDKELAICTNELNEVYSQNPPEFILPSPCITFFNSMKDFSETQIR